MTTDAATDLAAREDDSLTWVYPANAYAYAARKGIDAEWVQVVTYGDGRVRYHLPRAVLAAFAAEGA